MNEGIEKPGNRADRRRAESRTRAKKHKASKRGQQRKRVIAALQAFRGDKEMVARHLKIHPVTLWRWMKRLEITPTDYAVEYIPRPASVPVTARQAQTGPVAMPPEHAQEQSQKPREHEVFNCWCGKQHAVNPGSFCPRPQPRTNNLANSYGPRRRYY